MTTNTFDDYMYRIKCAVDAGDADKVEELVHDLLHDLGISPCNFPTEGLD